MATAKKAVTRSAKSSSQTARIRFSQIFVDENANYCHRLGKALDKEHVASLADSLVSEGQQTPLTVYDSGKKDKDGRSIYILVGGFRRFNALKSAVDQNLDDTLINMDMEIDVVVVAKGPEQSPEDFAKDLLVRSVAENEQRLNFTTPEKLEVVKRFRTTKVSDFRAASALSVSETQYRRFVSVIEEDWLYEHVLKDHIGVSHAAELIQAAKKHGRTEEFKTDFEHWVCIQKQKIEREREALAKIDKKLSSSAASVKKFITSKLVRSWLTCIEKHQGFTDNVAFKFGIRVDNTNGTITIPSVQLKIGNLSSEDYETMIGELEHAVDEVVPLMLQRRVMEQSTENLAQTVDVERSRIRKKLQQKIAAKEAAEAGHDAEDFKQVASATTTVVDASSDDEVDAVSTDDEIIADDDASDTDDDFADLDDEE
jgi:hypothetical protein